MSFIQVKTYSGQNIRGSKGPTQSQNVLDAKPLTEKTTNHKA